MGNIKSESKIKRLPAKGGIDAKNHAADGDSAVVLVCISALVGGGCYTFQLIYRPRKTYL